MSDKIQKIKKEFEKRIESMNSCPFKTAELGSEKFDEGELYAYKQILQFIDSLDSLPEEHDEDLEEEINRVDDRYPVELKYIQEIAHHFAEWQKQKDEQDFMKKACEYLEREYEDVGIRYIRGVSVDEEIELFKQYIENNNK